MVQWNDLLDLSGIIEVLIAPNPKETKEKDEDSQI